MTVGFLLGIEQNGYTFKPISHLRGVKYILRNTKKGLEENPTMKWILKQVSRVKDADRSFDAFANEDRGLSDVIGQILLVVLTVGLVGTVALSVGGVADDIFPGPGGTVDISQTGENVTVTIDNVDPEAENVTVSVASETHTVDTTNVTYDGTTVEDVGKSSDYPGADYVFTPPVAGSVMRINNLEEGDVVNVRTEERGSDNSNRIASYDVASTGL